MRKLIIILAVIAVVSSCKKEVLELAPISEIGENEFYTNNEELILANTAVYDALQQVPLREFAVTEMRSDNARSNSSEGDWGQFEDFAVASTNLQVGVNWSTNYNTIFRANRVLENLDAITDGDLEIQIEGEARFCRALAHFNLVRSYGDIPILDKTIGITEEDYFGRDPVSEVYTFIINDLLEAASLLAPKNNENFGRATSGAAEALLSKVYLNTGDYGNARTLLANLIASQQYALEDDYRDVFYNEGNDEIIFAIPYIDDDINESQDFSFEMTIGGVRSGLNYLTDDFKNGMNPLDTARRDVIQNPLNTNEVGKFLTSSSNARMCGNDWIVLRLADVYLMHVESIIADFGATQNLEAINSFNAVRDRVGLDLVPEDGTGEITLDMLLNERRYELSFENHRFYDLVRTGQAQTVLSAFAESEGHVFSSTDLLLPIPLSEINVSNGLLTQNPGYN